MRLKTAVTGMGFAHNINSIDKNPLQQEGRCDEKESNIMENVKVIIWGLGAMGRGIADVLLSKKGVDIAGVADMGDKLGKSMFDYLETDKGSRDDIIIGKAEDIIRPGAADIVILCTDSFTKAAFPKIKFILEQGINCITSAEEMAYPAASDPKLAAQLDDAAKQHGVSVLGTGINPGHIMDLLVLVMTGCMTDVKHILSKRVNSLSPFGPTVMEEQGIGITLEEFKNRKQNGTMSGHVGFAQSVGMIAEGIGLSVDEFSQDMTPIKTDEARKSPYGFAAAGTCAGVVMEADAKLSNGMKIRMEHPQQIEPEQAGVRTGDYVVIEGTPSVNLVNSPEVEGGLGTIAMCVNMIPQVINAPAGLHTMITLPVPRAIMGDMRNRIEPDKKIVK